MSKAQLKDKIHELVDLLPDNKLESILVLIQNETKDIKTYDENLVNEIFSKYDDLMKRLA
jgi:hypothetical protein